MQNSEKFEERVTYVSIPLGHILTSPAFRKQMAHVDNEIWGKLKLNFLTKTNSYQTKELSQKNPSLDMCSLLK